MKKLLLAALLLSLLPAGAMAKTIANPPTAEQKAAFLAQCLKVAPEAQTLCTCKSEAVTSLIDTDFIEVVIASMKGKPLDAKYYDAYNDYIARSNKVCKPDY